MKTKFTVMIISACVVVLVMSWWLMVPTPKFMLYESKNNTHKTPSTNVLKKQDVTKRRSRSVITLDKKIYLNKKIIQTKEQLNYWDKEQRSYQVYQPSVNSKARSGWVTDYNDAKSHKKYYKKRLDIYKALKK